MCLLQAESCCFPSGQIKSACSDFLKFGVLRHKQGRGVKTVGEDLPATRLLKMAVGSYVC